MPELKDFDPVQYSLEENQFFLEHLGEPPVAVLDDKLPDNVNPVEVKNVLGTIYDYLELEKHRGTTWCGIKPIRDSINTYLREWGRWKEMHARGAPRWPSMHYWDAKGRSHRGGTGSDSHQPRHWIDQEGNLQPFKVAFREVQLKDFVPDWMLPKVEVPTELIEDTTKGKIECPICGWATNYDPDAQSTRNMARARMAGHCKRSTKEPDLHRQMAESVFD